MSIHGSDIPGPMKLPKITGKERSTAMRISTAVEDFVRQHYGKQITYESWDGQKAEQTITLDHYGVAVEIIVRAVPILNSTRGR